MLLYRLIVLYLGFNNKQFIVMASCIDDESVYVSALFRQTALLSSVHTYD